MLIYVQVCYLSSDVVSLAGIGYDSHAWTELGKQW